MAWPALVPRCSKNFVTLCSRACHKQPSEEWPQKHSFTCIKWTWNSICRVKPVVCHVLSIVVLGKSIQKTLFWIQIWISPWTYANLIISTVVSRSYFHLCYSTSCQQFWKSVSFVQSWAWDSDRVLSQSLSAHWRYTPCSHSLLQTGEQGSVRKWTNLITKQRPSSLTRCWTTKRSK